ncbi:MAG: hypothetical protein ABI678_27575 [Kofleriaceae bacterium]
MTYLLDFAEDWAPVAFDERAVEHVPDHPIAAIVPPVPGQLAPPPRKGFHLLATLEDFAGLPDGAPRPRDLLGERYWPAVDAIVHLAAVRDLITPEIVANPVLRADLVAELFAACDAIASVGAPVRFITGS